MIVKIYIYIYTYIYLFKKLRLVFHEIWKSNDLQNVNIYKADRLSQFIIVDKHQPLLKWDINCNDFYSNLMFICVVYICVPKII